MNNNRITEYYRLSISQTSKKAGRYSQEDFTLYNEIIEKFKTLKEVEDYLKDYYFHFNGKRSKIYRDTLNTVTAPRAGTVFLYIKV